MLKSRLEKNILPKAKQRLLIAGLPDAQIIHLSRDPISMELGVINLADQTRVPGGRVRSGEFPVEIQFGRDQDRKAYAEWWGQAKDRPGDQGIDPAYKRDATIIYYRLFRGSAGVFDSGTDLPPVKAKLIGCWCSKLELPSGDVKADSGDEGDTTMKITIQYDDVELLSS